MQKKQYQKPNVVSIANLLDVTMMFKSSADTLYGWEDGLLESEGGAYNE